MELSREFRFEASHCLPYYDGPCARLHGHSWIFKITIEGDRAVEGTTTGMVKDYKDIKEIIQPIINDLDHRHLGYWGGIESKIWSDGVGWLSEDFNPTSENLIFAIASRLTKLHPEFRWFTMSIKETCTTECMLSRDEFMDGD